MKLSLVMPVSNEAGTLPAICKRLGQVDFPCPSELIGELLRTGTQVYELPIDYVARTREEGKKIRASDGIRGLLRLLEVRLRL